MNKFTPGAKYYVSYTTYVKPKEDKTYVNLYMNRIRLVEKAKQIEIQWEKERKAAQIVVDLRKQLQEPGDDQKDDECRQIGVPIFRTNLANG